MNTDAHPTAEPLAMVTDLQPAADWPAVYAQQLPRIYNFFRYRLGHEALAEDLTSRTF
jgi:DNA-directed RNA polymerase specialized sigma24 family protein